jgi:hypothetical protein
VAPATRGHHRTCRGIEGDPERAALLVVAAEIVIGPGGVLARELHRAVAGLRDAFESLVKREVHTERPEHHRHLEPGFI